DAVYMLALGGGEAQAEQADEGDNRRGTPYDSLHGGRRAGRQAEVWRPTAVVDRNPLLAQAGAASCPAYMVDGRSGWGRAAEGYSPVSRIEQGGQGCL